MKITNFKGFEHLRGQIVSFVNPFSYYMMRRDFHKYSQVIFLSDGFVFCLIARLFGFQIKRNSFDLTSIAPEVFQSARSMKVAVVGSTEINVQKFKEIVESKYNCQIQLAVSGFLSESAERELVKLIISEDFDLAIVGLGTPKQENFILQLKQSGYVGTAFTCGGFITQTANSDGEYYPHFINKYNLRFLYRMLKEPHTIKRYFFVYPVAILVFFIDILKGRVVFANND